MVPGLFISVPYGSDPIKTFRVSRNRAQGLKPSQAKGYGEHMNGHSYVASLGLCGGRITPEPWDNLKWKKTPRPESIVGSDGA